MKFILILLLASCLGMPAIAGSHPDKERGAGMQDTHRLRELRLRQALKNGDISPREAESMRLERRQQRDKRSENRRQQREARVKGEGETPHKFWRDKRRQSQRGASPDD
ncbi:hypothetical protein [Craterilacuibacter sp.]|uniref:hypothetical protein n=1 Tax=Craterilacuibacter sp. TaxID=2870909 RepID=UPI003F394507